MIKFYSDMPLILKTIFYDCIQTRSRFGFRASRPCFTGVFVQILIHSPVDKSGIDRAFSEVLNDGFSRAERNESGFDHPVDKVIHSRRLACG
jgi:hypothetical protein